MHLFNAPDAERIEMHDELVMTLVTTSHALRTTLDFVTDLKLRDLINYKLRHNAKLVEFLQRDRNDPNSPTKFIA